MSKALELTSYSVRFRENYFAESKFDCFGMTVRKTENYLRNVLMIFEIMD